MGLVEGFLVVEAEVDGHDSVGVDEVHSCVAVLESVLQGDGLVIDGDP